MKWSSNNRACKTIWSTLMVFEQISESQPFKTTGDIKVGDLTFYPKDASLDIVEVRARALALQIDKLFRMVRGATYEDTVDQVMAVNGMVAILRDVEKTVAELAGEADSKYLFHKEGE